MTINNTAYDTFMGRGLIIKPIQETLQDIQVGREILSANSGKPLTLKVTDGSDRPSTVPTILTPFSSPEQAVPVFHHPMAVTIPNLGSTPERRFLVGDARSFMTKDRSNEVYVSNVMEFEFLQARVGLGALWLNQGPQALRFISPLPQAIFASWVAENITRRFALDMGQQMRLQILAALFYQCQFAREEDFSDAAINRMAVPLAKVAKAPVDEAVSLLSQAGHITGLEDFVNKARMCLDNPRLESFNVGVLATIISGTWFGFGGKEIACAALEHPPTFMAMIYIALEQRGFKNAALANIVERYKGPKGGADYSRGVRRAVYL